MIKHSGKDGTRLYAGPLASQKKSFPAYQCQSAQYAKPSGGERSDRACAIRVRGISFTSSSPLTRNGREAPIPTSPRNPSLPGLRSIVRKSGKPDLRWGEVEHGAWPQT